MEVTERKRKGPGCHYFPQGPVSSDLNTFISAKIGAKPLTLWTFPDPNYSNDDDDDHDDDDDDNSKHLLSA